MVPLVLLKGLNFKRRRARNLEGLFILHIFIKYYFFINFLLLFLIISLSLSLSLCELKRIKK